MNYETLLAARIHLMRVDSLAGIYVGLALFVTAAVLIVLGVYLDKRERYSDCPLVFYFLAAVLGLISLLLIPGMSYNYFTAEIRARADLANYNLVELMEKK